jgi:transposase, IS5 family
MASTPWVEGIEAIVFRTVGDQPSLRESLLQAEVLRLSAELARVDALLDDPAFLAPFAPFFHPVPGRPSTPAKWYLRLMFLKSRYRLGYESLCAEVTDSISWRRFCRIPLDARVYALTPIYGATASIQSPTVPYSAAFASSAAKMARAVGSSSSRPSRCSSDSTSLR